MKIAVHGTGVAGPTLAWWLQQYGHQPVLFEKAPALRTGGYVIDFWGLGYDFAERMGLLPAFSEKGYIMESMRIVNNRGRQVAGMSARSFQALTDNRYLTIARSDLAAELYHACEGVETRFGSSITALQQHEFGVRVRVNDGPEEEFDLVIGADGLHSQIRALAFGPESEFEKDLGFYVAAVTIPDYPHRDELTYVLHTEPKRQVARVALRDNNTLILFIFRSELLASGAIATGEEKSVLRDVYRGMQWETPEILSRMDEVGSVYFDRVSQIRMPTWSNGRVALLGDAAACVSLLAGEGVGLAKTEAYVLAGELHQANGNHPTAFHRYETELQPFLAEKQESALKFAGFFAPKTRWHLFLRNLGTNLASIPFMARLLLANSLRDDYTLPEYSN